MSREREPKSSAMKDAFEAAAKETKKRYDAIKCHHESDDKFNAIPFPGMPMMCKKCGASFK